MVFMAYVGGKQLFHKYPLVTPDGILNRVSLAMEVLHENDLVFGNLRSPNILVTDKEEICLLDFDWCGKAEEGKYPADIDLEAFEWPEGVAPAAGRLLQLEQNDGMPRKLKERRSFTNFL